MALLTAGLSGQSASLSGDKTRDTGPGTRVPGSILIISLWALCLLSMFAVTLSYGVRQRLSLISRLDERERLRFISEAALKRAQSWLLAQPETEYAAFSDEWSNNPAVFKNVRLGEGEFSIVYTYYDELSGESQARYGLIDEERKINLNTAEAAVLERLFKVVAGLDEIASQELAASIVDWRDKDSELSLPIGSAEDSYYRNLRFPYEAKDAEFESLEESLLVKGMSEDIFAGIRDYVSVYGSGRVNVNTASRPVLLAVGFNELFAERIISLRAGDDRIWGTGDDMVFDSATAVTSRLKDIYHLSDSQTEQINVIVERYLGVSSDNFMLRCVSKLDNRKNVQESIYVLNKWGDVLAHR